jgi:hypothetical protein
MHRSSTRFPQTFAFAVFLVIAALPTALQAQAKEALLFRIFLKDGGTLVSYGEFARVAGRVLIPVPLGDVSGDPQLQVLSIPESLVDWDGTDAYASAVRGKSYADTRGEEDFAILTGHVTVALNDIGATQDPKRRLAMAQEARDNLAAWPSRSFGYKAAEVAQLVSIFDDVISEMKADAGEGQFDLSLVAMTLPPPPVALLPPPDVQASIEMAYQAALLAAEPAERTALLQTLADSLKFAPRDAAWAPKLRAGVSAALAVEQKADRAYGALVTSTLKDANTRAVRGDVKGLQSIIARALRSDDALGRKRPGEMAGLLATLDLKLDEAQRVRRARDAWLERLEVIRAYERGIATPRERIVRFRKWLGDIHGLAGPDPKFLRPLEERAVLALSELAGVVPPAEAQAVHQLFAASLQMTRHAAVLRRNAVLSNDIGMARDASSAAAGALALGERATEELERLISPPR